MNRSLKSKNLFKNSTPTSLSSEEEERELRQQRGKKEKMQIDALKRHPKPFDTYTVQTEVGIPYTVEIRSLNKNTNSCSCPDFLVNTLSTCKHIEGVLHQIKKQDKKLKTLPSTHVDIYLQGTERPQICIAWPKNTSHDVKRLLEPFFSSNNTLIADPITGLSAIEHALSEAPYDIRNQVRISSHLETWVENLKKTRNSLLSRQQFLTDVDAGKRSMHMLSVPLYPYQEEGMLHLAFKGRALLADEMGLGKTIQAIAACELLRRLHGIEKVLVICPASLKGEWEEQIAKFTGHQTLIVQGSRSERLAAYDRSSFFYLVNYEQVRSDFEEIQNLLNPDVIILDEAQRIKNWQTKTSWAVKQLKTPYAFVLTGTPIENRIEEIFSIMQVVDPHVLGPLFKFNGHYFNFNEKGKAIGYKNLDELYKKLKPVLLRRLKRDVEEQLPERTINNFFVRMEEEQIVRYEEYNNQVSRWLALMQKRPLTDEESKRLQQSLACMRMLADTPYILDDECTICPKLDELKQVLKELLDGTTNKIIIFSEWERMLHLVRDYIENDLGIHFAWHTGSVSQQKRREDIKRFKEDPNCRLFLTTDSGSTGLNLQVANVVINMDLPWNPAKLEQRIARAWRKNQTKAVQVINFISENTIEHRILATLAQKQSLADGVLDGIGDLSDMDIPSARKAILAQLNLLNTETKTEKTILTTPTKEPVSEINALTEIKNDIVAQFNDRVHVLNHFSTSSEENETFLAVVDQCDDTIKSKIEKVIHTSSKDSSTTNIEVLDRATYELLQRLQSAGIISIHADHAKTLHRSEEVDRIYQTERQQQLLKAKQHLVEAERKMRMAQLLASGGFVIEAFPAATETLEIILKGYFVLNKEPHREGNLLLQSIKMDVSKITDKDALSMLGLIDSYLKDFTVSIETKSL